MPTMSILLTPLACGVFSCASNRKTCFLNRSVRNVIRTRETLPRATAACRQDGCAATKVKNATLSRAGIAWMPWASARRLGLPARASEELGVMTWLRLRGIRVRSRRDLN